MLRGYNVYHVYHLSEARQHANICYLAVNQKVQLRLKEMLLGLQVLEKTV